MKKLGKSVPKTNNIRNRSTSQGVKLDTKKTPVAEIYDEAIQNLSSMKETFCTTKDMSKLYISKFPNKSEFIESILNKNKENNSNEDQEGLNLNDSFGNHKMSNRLSVNSIKISNKEEENLSNLNNIENNEASFFTNSQYNLKKSSRTLDLNENLNNLIQANQVNNFDPRLDYVLKILDLENLFHLFNSNKLTFNDILFLSKDDLIEMNICLVPRNRILKFSEIYNHHGRDYSLEEIYDFFAKNKHFVFNTKIDIPITNTNYSQNFNNYLNPNLNHKKEEEKVNFYENHVLSTANFNVNDLSSTQNIRRSQGSNHMQELQQENLINQNQNFQNIQNINQMNTNTGNNFSLSNYVSSYSSNINSSKNLPMKNIENNNTIPRGESEEKAIQTDQKIISRESELNNMVNLHTIKIEQYDSDKKSEMNSNQVKNVFINNLDGNLNNVNNQMSQLNQYNSETPISQNEQTREVVSEFMTIEKNENKIDKEISSQTQKSNKPTHENHFNSTLKHSQSLNNKSKSKSPIPKTDKFNKNLSSMVFRKNNVIQKHFDNLSNEVEKYIKNYKELKEKSEDRKNRLKCLISKTQKRASRSKSKDKKNYEMNYNFSSIPVQDYNSRNYNKERKIMKGTPMEVNTEDLRIEEERNLDEEMNKILNRINTASQQSLDSHSIQQLNRIKSLANLNQGDKNLKLVDIDQINKVTRKKRI
jgi:hypothetical protein